MAGKRKDSNRVVLRKGEGQRTDGTYYYRWADENGERRTVYAKTLDELRRKEEEIIKDRLAGINISSRYMTLNELFERWKSLKRGIRDMTFERYVYRYEKYIWEYLGRRKVADIKKSDILSFYNKLIDENGLMPSSVNEINVVLHQIFALAVDDDLLYKNPSDNVMREIKAIHSDKKRKKGAMTRDEQDMFIEFLKSKKKYYHLYNIVAVLLGTGMRIGEVVGLRYCDVNFDENYIDVNHTLVYYGHQLPSTHKGYYFSVHKPKTLMSIRKVPMMDFVKEAIFREKKYQEITGKKCSVNIDGYTDYIFITRNGTPRISSSVNAAIKRAIDEFNKEAGKEIIPHTTCHTFRHTFATRLSEAGTNIKAAQAILGHSSSNITLDVYTDATEELKYEAINGVEGFFSH